MNDPRLTYNKPNFTRLGATFTVHHDAHCVIHYGDHINTVGLDSGENREAEPAGWLEGQGFEGDTQSP